MGDDGGGLAALTTGGFSTDRYAGWSRGKARLLLFALIALLVAAALVPIDAGTSTIKTQTFAENVAGKNAIERPRDDDLALYDRAIARIRKGENYYDFIAQEHRKARYPLRPGVAVRLPTLAYLDAWLGEAGQIAASILLALAVMVAWWRRLGTEPGGQDHRAMALALLAIGASLGMNRYFFVLHELWVGMLLALSFGLHRVGRDGEKGRYGMALAVAALALAIREHALPFVLLMAAMAFWRRDNREGLAWSGLALAFLAALAVHLHIVSGLVRPDDVMGPSWLELRGLSGWLSNVVLSGNLRLLPHWLAGPAVIMAVFGWSAWKSPAGLFGTFLYLGYGLAFMIAGRGDNYYWGMVVTPAILIGLAFAGRGLASLTRAASAK